MDFDKLTKFILSWEGGYVNDPRDSGGATNMGVTLNTWKTYGYDKNKDGIINSKDIKLLNKQDFALVLRKYWNAWKADSINDSNLKYLIVDWYWCSGTNATLRIQKYLNVKVDGKVGNITINALNKLNGRKVFNDIWHLRENFLQTRAKFPIYGKGWLRRLNNIQYNKLITNNGITL